MLSSENFSRDPFTSQLNYFYEAIELIALIMHDFSVKQWFMNAVYER